MITDLWKREFTYTCLTLKYNIPADFYTSQWQSNDRVNKYYFAYRWIIALIFFVTLILSIIDVNNPNLSASDRAKWLIYLTHWGYAFCALQSILAVYLITSVYMKQRQKIEYIPEKHLNPKLYSLYWVLFTIATDAAFAITSIYWTLIFDKNVHPVNAMNIFVHGLNSVVMLTDLLIVRHPVRLLHCYWPFVFALVYITFNVIYYLVGGTDKLGNPYVYAILDWNNPGRSTLVTFLALMFLVFLHLFTYCLFLLRRHLHDKYFNKLKNRTLNIDLSDNKDDKDCKELSLECGITEHL